MRHLLKQLMRSVRAALMGGLLLSLGELAPSQAEEIDLPLVPQRGLDPQVSNANDPTQGVYVRDSAVAMEKFSLAKRMERLKEWNKSADILQEILEKYSDRVVPSQVDKNSKIHQYMGMAAAVQEQLARWPAEGLDVYRARYEVPAAAILEQARRDDIAALHRVYSLYFVTESGKAAGIRLMDAYLEAGEFAAAGWIADRLVTWHPNLIVERPMVFYRAALAQHLGGRPEIAAAWLDELKQQHAQAMGTVRGQDVILAESLEKELQIPAPVARSVSDDWPMFGGSPDRGRIIEASGWPGARLFSIDLSRPDWGKINPQRPINIQQNQNLEQSAGLTLGVMPVIDRGQLFFQDNTRIYAVSLESGVSLPGWAATHGGERNGQYIIPGWPMPRNHQFTVTVTDQSVLAIMNQTDPQAAVLGMIPPGQETMLVCLDRETGQEKWTTSAAQLPEEAAALRSLALNGSPLVVGDNVYVLGRGGKGQFEDCYVICFNLSDGKYRWSCYIASAHAGQQMWDGQNNSLSDGVSHLAYAGGRLYVLTHLGALAAVDAYGGAISWLNIYSERPAQQGQIIFRGRFNDPNRLYAAGRPWAYNPVVVKDGKVFILPADSPHVLIYDAGTGAEIKRINTDQFAGADTLLGIVDEKLILAGDKHVMCIDWKNYDSAKPANRNSNSLLWASPSLSSPAANLVPIRGRGFVTTDAVYIPTEKHLMRIDLKTGKVGQMYPMDPRTWEDNEGPGNILVWQNQVVIAGARRVNVYTDLELAKARLDEAVAAAPHEVEPRLRYAEVMFVAGQPILAMQKLDEAVELLGGLNSLRAGQHRDRLFHDSLTFARKLGKAGSSDEKSGELAAQLFDRAAAAAETISQQVYYRIHRARFARESEDYASAARLYQEILSDPRMRTVAISTENPAGPSQAAKVAEDGLEELIKIQPQAYELFERAAVDALREAEETKDPSKFLLVAQTYPNARIVVDAMIGAAGAYEAAGDSRQANRVLRELYFKYPNRETARILEAQARNYLNTPDRLEPAISRLSQAANKFPNQKIEKSLKFPDGQVLQDVTFNEALDALRGYRGQAAAETLADFKLPHGGRERREPFLSPSPEDVIPNVAMLALPLQNYSQPDRIITWTENKGISIYPAGKIRPLGVSDAITHPPVNSAWIDNNVIIWSGTEIALLNGENAGDVWTMQLKTLPAVEMVEDDKSLNVVVINGQPVPADVFQQNVQIRLNQQARLNIQIRQAGIGDRPARPNPEPQGEERILELRPVGDHIVAATSTGRLFCLKSEDGSLAWQTRMTDWPLDRLLANDDFTVFSLTGETEAQIVIVDTASGELRSRRGFPIQNGMIPLNIALSPDGTLVYTVGPTQPGRAPGGLVIADLFEPTAQAKFEVTAQNNAFDGMTRPDQLIVCDGRILAVTDQGRFVRGYSLETGQEIAKPLTSGANDPNIFLRIVGPHLYVIGRQTAIHYNLDSRDESWVALVDDTHGAAHFREAFIGQNHLVLLDEPNVPPEGAPSVFARLHAYARYPGPSDNSAESGRLDYIYEVTDPGGISQWQEVNGGFYYLTTDRKLHLLRGAKP